MFLNLALAVLLATSARAQTTSGLSTNPLDVFCCPSPDAAPTAKPITGVVDRREQIRSTCIQNRRFICGKIVKLLPGGMVVDSGYTTLLRQPLLRSWLVPGTVTASRPENLVEGHTPDSICRGLVFLTDTPKPKQIKPELYDYVIIEAYPAGHFTYASLGEIHRTVRRYSAVLEKAVDWDLQEGDARPLAAGVK